MNPKKTMIFAVVLALLAAGYFLLDRPLRQKKEQQAAEGEKVITMTWEAVNRIELKRDAETVVFEKKNGEWAMTAPVADEADTWAVQSLVSAFEHSTPVRKLDKLPADYAKTFGLDKPRVIATLSAGQDRKTVLIGNENPVGDTIYVQPQGAKFVYLLNSASVAALKKSVDDMRRRELLAPRDPEKKIKQVTIELAGEPPLTLLSKPPVKPAAAGAPANPEALPDEAPWAIDSPTGPIADQETIKQILDKLSTIRATEFVVNQQTDLSVYGLDKPSLVVTAVYGEGEKSVTKKLTVGLKPNDSTSWYVMAEGRPYVMTTDDASIKTLRVTRADLRDHRFLPNLDASQVQMIDLQTGEVSIRITRSGGAWKLADETPVQIAAIDNLFDAARKWRAEELVSGPRATALGRLVAGDKVITVTLYGAAEKVIARLRFSTPLDPETPPEPVSRRSRTAPLLGPTPAPLEANKRVVVLIDGGYEGTVYLAAPSVRDDIPTDPARLREQKPAAAPNAPPAAAPAPGASPTPGHGADENHG